MEVLLELSHELDYSNWLFGPFKSVYAVLENSGTLDIDVEDGANIIFTNKYDKLISIHLDFYRKVPTRKCIVQTNRGELTWNILLHELTWKDEKNKIIKYKYHQNKNFIYEEQMKHFIMCSRGEQQPFVNLDDGIKAIELVELIKKSHNLKRRISF